MIEHRFSRGQALTRPDAAREFLMLELAMLEHEVFYGLFLDNQHRILASERCFQGTVDGASVYPRELVKRALTLNASALIIAHNHPSGLPDASDADRSITRKVIDALALVDVRVLDHFLVAGTEVVSFAERGWL